MKNRILPLLAAVCMANAASADLYYVGSEAQESLPLRWIVGVDATWDDNVNPTVPAGARGSNESATSINPYIGLTFFNISPQQTIDVYARFGGIYYLDQPSSLGSTDFYGQVRVGVNWTRRISERLRFTSRNFVSYELEPNYAYGFASTRQADPYLYWSTDNSIGYRWTERLGTYSGFVVSLLDYDSNVMNNDRFSWTFYHQFRYQLTPQSVLTFDYRYSSFDANDFASDTTSHYVLLGIEHRFSPNTIIIARAGAQIRQSDAVNGSDNTSPFAEIALRSRINDQFTVRSFLRYSNESYDSTRTFLPGVLVDYDDRQTLRIGVAADYTISPRLSIFGGVDYITADFEDGRVQPTNAPIGASASEDLINAYIGLSLKITDFLFATLSYNYTDSSSDFINYTYDRNRVSLGLRAEF